jgi:hypothetical protein
LKEAVSSFLERVFAVFIRCQNRLDRVAEERFMLDIFPVYAVPDDTGNMLLHNVGTCLPD